MRAEVHVDSSAGLAGALRAHAALLRRGGPAVHVAVVDRPTVSYGVAVPETAPYLERARAEGIPTAPRSSGGTGILHGEGDLVWAVVLPRSDPRVGRDFVHAYGRLGAGVTEVVRQQARSAAWVPAPGLSDEYCPLGPRGFVLESQGRILAAAAQHLSVGALLHHGTLSVRVDRERLGRVFSATDPSALERLGSLDELGGNEPSGRLASALAVALDAALGPSA